MWVGEGVFCDFCALSRPRSESVHLEADVLYLHIGHPFFHRLYDAAPFWTFMGDGW